MRAQGNGTRFGGYSHHAAYVERDGRVYVLENRERSGTEPQLYRLRFDGLVETR